MRATWPLLGAIFVALSGAAVAPPVPVLPWTVGDTETYEGVPLVVAADVDIVAGGHLRLLGANVTVLSTALDPVVIRVHAGGILEMGPGVDALSGATVAARLDAPGLGYRLTVESGGRLDVNGAVIRMARWEVRTTDALVANATVGLTEGALLVSGGHLTLRASVLEGSPTDLLRVEAGTANIADSLLHDASASGVVAAPGSTVFVDGVTLAHLGGYGLLVDQADATLAGSVIEHTADYGVRVTGGSAAIVASTVDAHCAAFVTGGGSLLVEDSAVVFEENGLHAQYAGPLLVRGSSLSGGERALTLAASTGTVENSTITASTVGIFVRGSSLTVADATLSGNGIGIDVESAITYGPSTVAVRDSSFLGNSLYGIRNQQSVSVDARWTWWGAASGPNTSGADLVSGSALVTPWLAAPP